MWIYLYIFKWKFDFLPIKSRHMKKATSTGNAGVTILLAIGFLGLVMFLSYMFIASTMK